MNLYFTAPLSYPLVKNLLMSVKKGKLQALSLSWG